MALTFGTGPFAEKPSGHFSVTAPSRPLLFWEPFPKRLRIEIDGKTAVDTRAALALHETGQLMRLLVPMSDVKQELTPPRSFKAAPESSPELEHYISPDFEQLKTWYLEDDLGYAHPRDPYHRFDVHRSSRRVLVKVDGVTVAETLGAAILFETSLPPRYYFPPDAIRSGLLERSEQISQCPYKGDGQHWHVNVGGKRVEDAAWSLTTPMGDALTIPRWFSFYAEKVDIEVDGNT